MLKNLKVAAIQAKVPKNHFEGEKQILRLVRKATSRPVDIIGLSEECLASAQEVEKGYDPFKFLKNVAKENKVCLFGANMAKDKGKIYTIGFFIDNNGKIIVLQKKVVLTPLASEAGISAGTTIKIFDTEFGKMAILVCKDSFHRYSAWFFNQLMKAGVDVVLVPSSSVTVSERSINLWTDTIKTMSMLFNVFIIAPGTFGINGFDGTDAFGHSLIVSPQKVVLAEGSGNKEEILYATLEKDDLDRLRSPEAAKWQPTEIPQFKIKEL